MRIGIVERTFALYLVLLALAPLVIKGYWLHVMILGNIYAILAMTLDLLVGYTGLMSFAHGGFFGLAAYSSAILSKTFEMNPWVSLVAATMITICIGGAFGLSFSGVRGHYFAICSIGLNQIIWLIMLNWYELTRGMLGFYGVPPYPGLPYTKEAYFYLSFAVFVLAFLVLRKLTNSPLGLKLRAVRDDEGAAQSVGINSVRCKTTAFVIGCAFTGVAGSIYAHFHLLVAPETCHISVSSVVLAMVLIGGKGTLIGPALMAYFLEFITEYFRIFSAYLRLFATGILIIFIIKFMPEGVLGFIRERYLRPRKMFGTAESRGVPARKG